MKRDELNRLLDRHLAGELTGEELERLSQAALEDQEIFNALGATEALKEAFEDPRAAALFAPAPVAVPVSRRWPPREWPMAYMGLAALVVVGVGIVALVLRPPPPVPRAEVKPTPPEVVAPGETPSPVVEAPVPALVAEAKPPARRTPVRRASPTPELQYGWGSVAAGEMPTPPEIEIVEMAPSPPQAPPEPMAAWPVPVPVPVPPAAPQPPPVVEPVFVAVEEVQEKGYLKDILFGVGEDDVPKDQRDALAANAAWLKRHPTASIVIEGHSDDPGDATENKELAEKRAVATKFFLLTFGVDGDRMETVSYGNERRTVAGSDKTARRMNRRVHFVLVSRTPSGVSPTPTP